MRPAVVPDSLIAERRHLGIDKQDEVWEGVRHMNEPGNMEHQELELRLAFALWPVARGEGLLIATEVGVFDQTVSEYRDFRTPDVVVYERSVTSDRGVEGRAALAVEIRSPGDDSFEKIPFYGQVGVAELLIIDRDTKAVRRWVHDGAANMAEVAAGQDGWHQLAALPVRIRGWAASLELQVGDKVHQV